MRGLLKLRSYGRHCEAILAQRKLSATLLAPSSMCSCPATVSSRGSKKWIQLKIHSLSRAHLNLLLLLPSPTKEVLHWLIVCCIYTDICPLNGRGPAWLLVCFFTKSSREQIYLFKKLAKIEWFVIIPVRIV